MEIPSTPQPAYRVSFSFAVSLRFLLPRELRTKATFTQIIRRRASLKDVVEALGVPHTEIGALYVNGQEVGFAQPLADRQQIRIDEQHAPCEVTRPSLLRPEPLPHVRFIVDANVARLAKLLRATGFDTTYDPKWTDAELARLAAEERRILLTRDRALLRYGCIDYGHLVRSSLPKEQLREVLRLYGLQEQLRPFSRCMRCNGPLEAVDKAQTLDQLEPLTIRYYDCFKRCTGCGQVYWDGSHKKGLEELLFEATH